MFHVPCLSKTLPFLAAKFSTFLMEDGTLRRIIIKYNITVFLVLRAHEQIALTTTYLKTFVATINHLDNSNLRNARHLQLWDMRHELSMHCREQGPEQRQLSLTLCWLLGVAGRSCAGDATARREIWLSTEIQKSVAPGLDFSLPVPQLGKTH